MNPQKETLWLPDGFGQGTIVYDKDENPYQATKKITEGAEIYEMTPIDKEVAEKLIKNGNPVLTSNEN